MSFADPRHFGTLVLIRKPCPDRPDSPYFRWSSVRRWTLWCYRWYPNRIVYHCRQIQERLVHLFVLMKHSKK